MAGATVVVRTPSIVPAHSLAGSTTDTVVICLAARRPSRVNAAAR